MSKYERVDPFNQFEIFYGTPVGLIKKQVLIKHRLKNRNGHNSRSGLLFILSQLNGSWSSVRHQKEQHYSEDSDHRSS